MSMRVPSKTRMENRLCESMYHALIKNSFRRLIDMATRAMSLRQRFSIGTEPTT